MIDLMLLIGCIATWYAVGCYGFVYWWTSEFDLTSSDLPLALFIGLLGPVGYLFGWMIHGKGYCKPSRVLLKKK